ncbi:MAG TPA: hypothetical protein VHZ75_03305 [Solirubrobacteraceae bacterium]|nr:hypothetical protein [Solirubrobacteraceae bacterium]
MPAADVVALLNRIGECVRALPSFGRTRTQTAAVVAKRTLSAISTCSPSGLADRDELRPVLARLGASRNTLRDEYDAPAHAYVIRNGEVFRELDGEAASDAVGESDEERIQDLARAGAVIAAEIDRLQRHQQRRYA